MIKKIFITVVLGFLLQGYKPIYDDVRVARQESACVNRGGGVYEYTVFTQGIIVCNNGSIIESNWSVGELPEDFWVK